MPRKRYKKSPKIDIKIMAKGVDSLFLYVDCADVLGWDVMVQKIEGIQFDECFKINNVDFIKVKAWIRSFPQCIKSGQFMLFLNVKSCYVRVLSLGFELYGFDKVVLKLCALLEKITRKQGKNWLDCLRVSRIDCYCDFAYNGDFDFELFRTKLRKKGIFKSSDHAEGITYYFGSRDLLLCRLYAKSVEIEKSGKDYLRSAWEKNGCKNDRIWRLEFEFHKMKIEEITRYRELVNIQGDEIKKLFAYGLDSLEYVAGSNDSNFARRELSPIWKQLKQEFNAEYRVTKQQVRKANINYRFKRARKCVISWLIAQGLDYDEVERFYVEKFRIDRFRYEKELTRYQVHYNRVNK